MTPVLASAHPLLETIERIAGFNNHLQVRLGPQEGQGWVRAVEFLDPHSPFLERAEARIGAQYETDDRKIRTGWTFAYYCWPIAVVGVAAYLAEQRVPDLAPASLALHLDDDGDIDGIALLSRRFAALPGDPAAEHADVLVLPDQDALRGHLRAAVEAHLAPLVEIVRARGGWGQRALWATVADRLAYAAIWLSQALQRDSATCRQEVQALVATPPLKGKTGVQEVQHNGQRQLFLQRGACCLAYTLPAHNYCAICPLLSSDERTRRLQAEISEHEEAS
jgi:hypothetical protein